MAIVLTAAIGIAVSGAFYVVSGRQDRERVALEFGQQASRAAEAVAHGIDDLIGHLEDIRGLYGLLPAVDRHQFRAYVTRELTRNRNTQAVSWIPRVPDRARDEYERAARRDGYLDFEFTEETISPALVRRGRRPEYFPVYFIEPSEGNAIALGFDLASNPVRLAALERARDTGLPAATVRLRVVQETRQQFSVLILVPIYGRGGVPTTVEDRRVRLHGFASGVLRIGELVDASLRGLDLHDIDLELTDENAPEAERTLYRRLAARDAHPPGSGLTNRVDVSSFAWMTSFDVGDRRWVLRLAPTPAYLGAHLSPTPWIGLTLGLALTAVLVGYLTMGTHRALALARAKLALQREVNVRRRAEETARALADLGREFVSTLDLSRTADRIVSTLVQFFPTYRSALFLLDTRSGGLRCVAAAGSESIKSWIGKMSPPGTGVAGRAVAEGRVVTVVDPASASSLGLPEWAVEAIRAEDLRTLVALPLVAQGTTVGALSLGNTTGAPMTGEDLELLSAFADHAAIAIQNAQLFEGLQSRQRSLEALLEATRQLSSIQPLETLVHRITEACGSLLGTDSVGLRIVEGDELVIVGTSGDAKEMMPKTRLKMGESLSGRVAKTGEPLMVLDLAADERVIAAHREPLVRAGYRSWLGVPVKVGDRVAGVLSVRSRNEQGFSAGDVSITTALAAQAATALENARLYAEVRNAYEQLSRTQEQLTQAQKMEAIGRLAGGVAHDFNNLLTIITGRSVLLRKQIGADKALGRHVDLIEKTAQRAAGLTRQLLAFSRKQVLQPKVLDLNALVGNIGAMLRRLIGEDVNLVTALGPRLAAVKADPGQLEQVLMNLVVNARDAMPSGGRVTIETANVALDPTYAAHHAEVQAGPYVLLAVSDTGTGMDAATQAHLFEPFFTTKGPGKGTGLGLATVYGIVKQSGGHVSVYSELGHGTTFKIYLPAADQPAEAGEDQPAAIAPTGSETVLLVEDEEDLRDLLAEALEASGYTVLKARDCADAIKICVEREAPIHLLLTDVIMPRMSGRELVERVHPGRPTMKVLYMSGYTDGAIVHHGVLEPGIAFLQKPFAPPAVAQKVREVLDGPQRPAVALSVN